MKISYRRLNADEVSALEANGCSAESWEKVSVSGNLEAGYIHDVHFSGEVRLGPLEGMHVLAGGIRVHSALRNVVLHQVETGVGVLIEDVGYISNYKIGDHVRLQRCSKIYVEGVSSFGNGVEVPVLSEAGGREVPIYDRMSAQVAYMMAMYRYCPEFISAVKRLAADRTFSLSSAFGVIGSGVVIEDVQQISGVKVGRRAYIHGALLLDNGTVGSDCGAVTEIGNGVIGRNFIIQSASRILDGAVLSSVLVGQGCTVSGRFSAADSLIFSNSHLENGESAALFAGPYTVSHHKSTLLIGTLFSFMNAGSATNFSNHLYKLGPMHQGIFGRGVKCASGSYMMLPVRVGAFSTIIGHHVSHCDTSDFPFSYLVESKGSTKLIPGIALNNAGLYRDEEKWPARDHRPAEGRIDSIVYDVLSPYTYQAVRKGYEILKGLSDSAEEVEYHGVKIDPHSVRRGIEIYEEILFEYPHTLWCRFSQEEPAAKDPGGDSMISDDDIMEWVDISGLITPKIVVEKILEDVSSGHIGSVEELEGRMTSTAGCYGLYLRRWLAAVMRGVRPDLHRWADCAVGRLKKILADASKEYSEEMCVGFGQDAGDAAAIKEDLSAVRGTLEETSFCRSVRERIGKIEEMLRLSEHQG